MMLQTDPAHVAEVGEAPDATLAAQAAAPNPAPVARPASPETRRPILEAVLDAHMSGEGRWALVSKVLAAVEGGLRPVTRAEVLAAVPEPGVDRVVGLLLARRVLVERTIGRKTVLSTGR